MACAHEVTSRRARQVAPALVRVHRIPRRSERGVAPPMFQTERRFQMETYATQKRHALEGLRAGNHLALASTCSFSFCSWPHLLPALASDPFTAHLVAVHDGDTITVETSRPSRRGAAIWGSTTPRAGRRAVRKAPGRSRRPQRPGDPARARIDNGPHSGNIVLPSAIYRRRSAQALRVAPTPQICALLIAPLPIPLFLALGGVESEVYKEMELDSHFCRALAEPS